MIAVIGDPDDSARQAGLTALLAVLVIILFVQVIISVILGTIYYVKWRRGEFSTIMMIKCCNIILLISLSLSLLLHADHKD